MNQTNTPAAETAQPVPVAPPAPARQSLAAEVMPQAMAEFELQQRMAKMFAASGLFADLKGIPQEQAIAQAYFRIALGASMGYSPAESMQGIDIIQGRPAIGAHLRAARVEAAGITWPQMVLNDKGCWMPLCQYGRPMLQPKINAETGEMLATPDGKPVMVQVVVSFTMADATKMGLTGKDNWKKNPHDMLFARCVTRVQRRYAPSALGVTGGRILDRSEASDGDFLDIEFTAPVPEIAPSSEPITVEQSKRISKVYIEAGRTAEDLGKVLASFSYGSLQEVKQCDLDAILAEAVDQKGGN